MRRRCIKIGKEETAELMLRFARGVEVEGGGEGEGEGSAVRSNLIKTTRNRYQSASFLKESTEASVEDNNQGGSQP
jgi:hypothetical protein